MHPGPVIGKIRDRQARGRQAEFRLFTRESIVFSHKISSKWILKEISEVEDVVGPFIGHKIISVSSE